MHMAAVSREGKKLRDVLFQTGVAAQEAIGRYGPERVVNGSIGCYAGEDEVLACLPLVEELYRTFPMKDFITYAPPAGLEEYRRRAAEETFEDCRPDGFVDAVATAGGTGAVHMAIANYSEYGDAVLVSDWRWGIYDALCGEIGRSAETFALFDDSMAFNIESFSSAVASILRRQDSLLIILNTPAHNPTGFALSCGDWDEVLQVCRLHEKQGKRISILVDIAYIAYAGEKNDVRRFMTLFGNLPPHLFVLFAFSMSKGYTLYGQRAGALVGVSSERAVIDEFVELGRYSARASWSNVNRAAMTLLTTVRGDESLRQRLDGERLAVFNEIRSRAAIFTEEAAQCGLRLIPSSGGFFVSVPLPDAAAVSRKLEEELIFVPPLPLGIRIGVCSIPKAKIHGLAEKIKKAASAVQ